MFSPNSGNFNKRGKGRTTPRIWVLEKEGNNWHLEGLITLDENLYAEIDPAQALKLINNNYDKESLKKSFKNNTFLDTLISIFLKRE